MAGAGAETTALNECLHAYACAARQSLGKSIEDISEIKTNNTSAAACDRNLNSCLKGLDDSYYYSAITIANQMFLDYPALRRGNYIYARGKEIDKIYSAFNRLKKNSTIGNANKWNPADIWVIKKGFTIKPDWTTLSELNEYLYEQYYNNNLIGVSLKKLDERGGAHKQVFNDGEPASYAKFSGFRIGADMRASKDVYIQFSVHGKPGEIQLRTFSSRPEPGSWQGEIKGKTAAGGKIGGGKLIQACVESKIPSSSLLQPSAFRTHIDKPSDQKFKEFAKMYKELTRSRDSIAALATEAKGHQKRDKTWWMTKFLGVHYCYVVADKKKENKVVNWLYNYGSSATSESSIFVKYS